MGVTDGLARRAVVYGSMPVVALAATVWPFPVVVVFAALDDLELPHPAAINPRTMKTAITRRRIRDPQ